VGQLNDVFVSGDKVNADGYFARLMFRNSNQSGGSTASVRGERSGDNFGTALTFYTQAAGSSGDGTEKLRITPAGNVGIGTTAPGAKLVVSDTNAVIAAFGRTGTTGAQIALSDSVSSAGIGCSSGALTFGANGYDNERARIDSAGRLLVGTSSSTTVDSGAAAKVQTDGYYAAAFLNKTADSFGPYVYFAKSRGGTTIVQNGDTLGGIAFNGCDGTDFETFGASIAAQVDGTPGANDMPGRIVFSTTADGASSPTERMRIDSTGYVGVNVTNPAVFNSYFTAASTSASKAAGVFFGNAASNDGMAAVQIAKSSATNTSSQVLVDFWIDSFNTGSGRIVANGASSAAFASYSDIRLKDNIQDLPGQLANICNLRPVEFDYKDGSGHQIGFIAQEVQQVYPDVVATGDNDMLTLTGWSKTEARLVKALQEAVERIETLEAKVAALEGV
jgi:hypothetical protein